MIFQELRSHKRIEIKRLSFFKEEIEAIQFIDREGLELINDKKLVSTSNVKDLINLINKYLSGENIDLFDKIQDLGIDLNIQEIFSTTFSQKVVKSLINLKFGDITSYSQIGKKIGSKAYRAIGNVCKSNPIPLIIPCHRVLRKNGEIGGFMGKSNKTWETNLKIELLKIEGYQNKDSKLLQSKLI